MAPIVHSNQRHRFSAKKELMQSMVKVYVTHVMRGITVHWVQLSKNHVLKVVTVHKALAYA
jgi:hypothetical protein